MTYKIPFDFDIMMQFHKWTFFNSTVIVVVAFDFDFIDVKVTFSNDTYNDTHYIQTKHITKSNPFHDSF